MAYRPQYAPVIALQFKHLHTRNGGESGIRTHGRFDPSPVFKTGALNRSAISPLKSRSGQAVGASQVGLERVRYGNGTISVLVVLHHRNHGATDGQAGAVQGVDQLGLAGFGVAPA